MKKSSLAPIRRVAGVVLVVLFVGPTAASLAGQEATEQPDHLALWTEARALFRTEVVLPPAFDPAESHTLVLALHGYGSTAEAFRRSTAPFTSAGFIVALPEAAYPMLDDHGELAFDWWLYQFPEDEALHLRAATVLVTSQLPAIVEDLRDRYLIDRVYVYGFSQGAMTAYMLGLSDSDPIDGVIAFGGMVSANWFQDGVLERAAGLPVLIVHGAADVRMAPESATRARDLLVANGNEVTLRTFDGGHVVPLDEVEVAAKWILEHQQATSVDVEP
jgi:phospholipase/carboxylesterase